MEQLVRLTRLLLVSTTKESTTNHGLLASDIDKQVKLLLHPEYSRSQSQTASDAAELASSPRAHQLSLSCLSCCLAVSRHSKESAAVRVQALSGPLTALLPFFNRRPNDPAVDIVNSLFKPLLQEYQASVTKLPSSVKSALFLVLGKCIQTHPKPFLLQQDGISLRQTLSRYTADEIETQLFKNPSLGKKSDQISATGALLCLNEIMFHPPDLQKDYMDRISRTILYALNPSNTAGYSLPKAALVFLTNHSSDPHLLRILIIPHHAQLHKSLVAIASPSVHSSNREFARAGVMALDAFLKAVAAALVLVEDEEADMQDQEKTTNLHHIIFQHFIKDFTHLLVQDSSSSDILDPLEIAYAIRGVGIFARPLHRFCSLDQINTYHSILISKMNVFFSDANDQLMENLRHISAFNEAFANMLLQFGKGETGSPQLPPPPKFMEAVEHLLLINISHFSKAFMSVKYINSAAMRQLLWAVYCLNSSSSTSSSMFPNILHHALLATISNDPASSASAMYTSTSSEDDFDGVAEVGEGGGGVGDDMLQTPDDNSQKPYLEFVVLWEVLFKIPSKDDATDQQHSFCEFIFDTTMSSLINIIHCLNLDTTTIEDKEQQQQQDSTTISTAATIPSDFISSVSAQNPHDILLLHHLVDFYTFFLSLSSSTSNRWKRFTKWILPCGEAFSRLSAKHPHISALYRLIMVNLLVCTEMRFFDDIVKPEFLYSSDRRGISDELVPGVGEEKTSSYILHVHFLRQVVQRSKTFKDELLASCLKLLLASPKPLISIATLVEPICLALSLGLSYLPLASDALAAVKMWIREYRGGKQERKLLSDCLELVIPYFKDYLMLAPEASSTTGSGGVGDGGGGGSSVSSSSTSKKTHFARMMGSVYHTSDPFIHVQVRQLQMDIMRMLGSISGGDARHIMSPQLVLSLPQSEDPTSATSSSSSESSLVRWGTTFPQNLLPFTFSFTDLDINLALDPLLPRITQLAQHSPDRKTKVAACELLHAITVYLVGKSAMQTDSNNNTSSSFTTLYTKLFPCLIRLAVDLESIARSLFRPLFLQLIHWFTRNSQYENQDTISILNSCLDAVSSSNGPIRDFGADCCVEFLKYSIKQTTAEEQAQNPFNAKSLLKRLYQFATHTLETKRTGAATVFCRIYIVFREEASLVDMFSLEILYHLLASLRLSEMDNINSFQNSASSASTLSSSSIVCTAIDHWKKIILKSMDLLLAPNERRMSFPPLMQQLDATASGSSSSHSLDACIAWLFVESGRPFGEYSRKCLELFMELQSRKAPPVRDWLDIQLAKNPNLLVSTFESSEGPNVTIPKLVAAFDVYITLVSQRIIPVSQTFTALTCGSPSSPPPLRQLSPFPSSPVLFVKSIVFLTEIIKFSNINNELEVDSCRALDRFRDRGFLTDAFFDRLAACCFNPESVFGSSNEGDVATSDRFSNLIRQVVSKLSLLKSSNHPVYQKFVQAITSLYSSTKSVILLRKPPILFKIKDISFFNGVSLLLNCCKQALVGEWLGSLEWIVTSIAAATATMSSSLSVSSPGGNINEQVLTHLVEICLSHEQLCIMFYRDIMGLITTSSPESFRLSLPKLYPSILTHILNGSAINGGWAGLVKIISDVDIDVEVFGELLSRLIDVLQSSSSKKHLASSRARFINMFKASLTSLQDIFSALANKDQVLFLSIVQRLLHLLLDSSLLGDHLLSLTVAGITSVVQSGSSTPPQIRNMLQILPSLIKPTEQHQHHQKPIISAIQSLVYESKHFPISPVDLQEGSSQAVEYSGFISCLMNVVRVSGNPLLVDILINHTCRVQHHPQLTQAITSCTSFLGNPHPLLDIGLSRLYQPDFPASFKVNTASQLILPLLKACHLSALREFVCSKIKMIMAPLLASREFRNDDDNDISIRCIHLEMIAVFYSRLSMEDLHNKNSRILIAYCDGIPPSVDNILTKDVTRVTHESKRKIAGSALSYCQSAHNALSAAISCTQTEERFYTAFLFMENESKNEAIWENIVPCQETWNFVKVQFLSDLFGSTNSNSSATKFSGSSVFSSSTSQMSYMSSQYLKHSSLSTVPLSQEGNLSLQDETVSVENVTSAPTLSLPQTDFINRHPCMQTICEIVKKLGGMINVDGDDALPGWMSKLLEKIQATETHINIRLFIAKIIINNSSIFGKHSSQFWKPLAALIGEGEKFGKGINEIILQILVCLNEWISQDKSAGTKPSIGDEEVIAASLAYLSRHIPSKPFSLINQNQKLVRTLIQRWKEHLNPPTPILFSMMSHGEDKDQLSAIYFLSNMAANDLDSFDIEVAAKSGILRSAFHASLVNCLERKNLRKIYIPAAEVVGRVLEMHRRTSNEQGLLDLLTQTLVKMSGFKESALQGSPSDQDHFIELIQRISIGFPSIVVKNSLPTNAATDFSKNLLYILPKLSQEMKGLVLESFISVADQIGGLFVELKAKVFHLWPHHDEVFQTSLLLVLNSLAPTLDIGDIDSFMDIIIHIFPQHSSSKCRSAFYTLMLKLYAQPSVQTSGNAHIKIMQAIILGLRDEDAQIKTAISSFINTTSLSLEFTKRVQQLVQNYYLPELEESFLHYTLYMTLELCRGSRAWDKPLFDQALSDVARFNDVIINMDWRGGDALSMRPLFASTQGDAAKYSSDIVKLRQTQAMQWTPTINFDASQARSIFSLSGSQIDDGSSAGGGGTSSIKQFNQSASASIQRARQFQRGPSGYKLSDKFVFARNAEQKHKRMIRAEKSQKEARSRQVALSRKYRSGELPDIQICVREIVEPLQALVLLDIRLAKSVFVGLVSSAGAASNSPSLEMFKSELYSSIYSIFQITVMFYTPFIGCLLEILLEAPTISCASDLLLRVVKHSGNFHLGALVLEKMLSPAHSPLHNRNRSTVASSESTLVITSVSESDLRAWEDLCSVYQMLDRPDISQSIIEKVGLFGEGYAKALSREANEDYDAALKLYEEASGHHKSLFAKRRILHCQHQLGLWDEMKDIFTSAVVGEMWDNDVYREEFLPVFMEQSVKLTTSPSSLFNGFLLSSSKMDAKQTFLEQKYAPFLALYHASHSDPSFARSFVKKSFEGVLDAFSATHPLCDEARLSLISSLQMVNEIDEFLEASSRAILAGEGDDACEQVYKDHLIQHWMNRFPSSSNTALTVWDNVICARNILLTKVVSSVAVESLELVNRKRIANAARMHAQFAVGSRWLKPLWESSKAETIYPVSKILIAKLDMAEDATDIAARCGDVMGTFKVTLRKVEDALSHSKMIKFQIMNAEFSSLMLAKLVRSSDALWKCLNQSKFIVKQAHDIESNDGYIEFFSNRGFQALTRATAMLQSSNEIAQAGKIQVLTEKLLLKFAQFTNQVLRISESSTSASASRKSTLLDRGTTHLFSKVCIESTLDAMSKFSSLAASEFFIRCVYLLDSAGMNEAELSSSFQLKSADVPAWMFLRWLPQLTSLLSKPNLVKPVGDLLLRVAQEYPSALRLPIALSSEQYHVQNSGKSLTSSLNSVVSRQVSMTKSELFSLFMEELQRLEEPSFIFKTWLFEFKAVFDERSSLGVSELKQRFQKMVSLCLYPNSSSRFGSFGQKFARAHSANIFQICGGRNGDTLMKMTRKDLDELLVYFANKIRHDTSTGGPGPKTLKSFSPWLYAYSSGNFLEDLEIPGQYENITQRPDLRSIVRLEKVNESILQLASIRKPKRLVMLGSDGVEYPWLVKAGEDIRLDQRVQQLFSVMNSALSKSSSYCERHYIRLRTFKVVPMSTKLGILEWMSGTRTLRDCMIKSSSSSLSSTSSSFEVDDANAFIELQKSLTKHATKKTANRRNLGLDAELYAAFNKNASRDDSIRGIRAAVSQMTRSYLRSYFYQIAAAPENFIVLRNNFVQSLAAINVCSYILGIGDRHLENLLIDTTSGRLVSIDFGHAFGSATEVLPIPELIPFRLTDQMERVMSPLSKEVMLRQPMASVLTALRSNKQGLLNLMDIFINEPLVEWRERALNIRPLGSNSVEQGGGGGAEGDLKVDQGVGSGGNEGGAISIMGAASSSTSSSSSSSSSASLHQVPEWYPIKKLEIARRKLDGENPCHLLVEELEMGHGSRDWFQAAKAAVMGSGGGGVGASTITPTLRSTAPRICQDVQQQVDCLLDLATDQDLLGRTYVGWKPWC